MCDQITLCTKCNVCITASIRNMKIHFSQLTRNFIYFKFTALHEGQFQVGSHLRLRTNVLKKDCQDRVSCGIKTHIQSRNSSRKLHSQFHLGRPGNLPSCQSVLIYSTWRGSFPYQGDGMPLETYSWILFAQHLSLLPHRRTRWKKHTKNTAIK